MGPKEFLDIIAAVSNLAEMNALYYRQLLQEGFTPEQAIELVKVMTATMLSQGKEAN